MRIFIIGLCALGSAAPCLGDTVVIEPVKDNTLVQIADGSLSLALSQFVFAGRTGNHGGNGTFRRGLMKFDIAAAVPSGAVVESVELAVFCTQTNSGPYPMGLHRVLQDWGEGESDAPGGGGGPATPGDATWLHTFWPDQYWTNIGGDFDPTPSCVTEIGFPGPYVITSTPGLVADVQAWLDDPGTNFGWLFLGNETDFQSVKALGSRHNRVPKAHPMLTINFSIVSTPNADLDGDGLVNGADLGLLLSAWGVCPAEGRCAADLDESGAVDGADLGVLLASWSPPA